MGSKTLLYVRQSGLHPILLGGSISHKAIRLWLMSIISFVQKDYSEKSHWLYTFFLTHFLSNLLYYLQFVPEIYSLLGTLTRYWSLPAVGGGSTHWSGQAIRHRKLLWSALNKRNWTSWGQRQRWAVITGRSSSTVVFSLKIPATKGN